MKKFLRYMKGTQHYENLIEVEKDDFLAGILDGYSDTDWAKDQATRKSLSCGILMIGGAVINSYSRSQTVVATSSGEAEFYGLAALSSEAMFVVNMLGELGFSFKGHLFADSSSAKSMASRTGVGKVKHLEIRSPAMKRES